MLANNHFDESALYRSTDPALEIIARPQTWRAWRHRGTGPDYLRIGNRVFYRGADLNHFLESHLIEPSAA